MTVREVTRTRWLLRALLAVAAGILVAVLTSLWSAPSAHAADELTPPELADVTVPVADAPPEDAVLLDEPPPEVGGLLDEPPPEVGVLLVEPAPDPADVPPGPVVAPADEPDAPVTAPGTEAVEPSPAGQDDAPAAVTDVSSSPETATPASSGVPVRATTVETDVAGPPATLTPSTLSVLSPVPEVQRVVGVARASHLQERVPRAGPPAPQDTVAVPPVPAAEAPCPPVEPPVVSVARPWAHGLSGTPGPDGPAPSAPLPPVTTAPVLDARGGPTRDDPGAPAGLAVAAAVVTGCEPGPGVPADGTLPAEVEPPQLRLPSDRAGPGRAL